MENVLFQFLESNCFAPESNEAEDLSIKSMHRSHSTTQPTSHPVKKIESPSRLPMSSGIGLRESSSPYGPWQHTLHRNKPPSPNFLSHKGTFKSIICFNKKCVSENI